MITIGAIVMVWDWSEFPVAAGAHSPGAGQHSKSASHALARRSGGLAADSSSSSWPRMGRAGQEFFLPDFCSWVGEAGLAVGLRPVAAALVAQVSTQANWR
jgi:hypothetical protein